MLCLFLYEFYYAIQIKNYKKSQYVRHTHSMLSVLIIEQSRLHKIQYGQ